jgi:hypothetical protein
MNWQDKKITAMAFRCKADSKLGFEHVDEGSKRVTGYTPTDLVEAGQASLPDLIQEKERDHIRQQIQDGLNRQGSFAVQFNLLTKEKNVVEGILIGKGIFSTPLVISGIEGYIIRMQE